MTFDTVHCLGVTALSFSTNTLPTKSRGLWLFIRLAWMLMAEDWSLNSQLVAMSIKSFNISVTIYIDLLANCSMNAKILVQYVTRI